VIDSIFRYMKSKSKKEMWYINGLLDRADDKPAVVYTIIVDKLSSDNPEYIKKWYKCGKPHRDIGSATEYSTKITSLYQLIENTSPHCINWRSRALACGLFDWWYCPTWRIVV
jgi:hypothetical protein